MQNAAHKMGGHQSRLWCGPRSTRQSGPSEMCSTVGLGLGLLEERHEHRARTLNEASSNGVAWVRVSRACSRLSSKAKARKQSSKPLRERSPRSLHNVGTSCLKSSTMPLSPLAATSSSSRECSTRRFRRRREESKDPRLSERSGAHMLADTAASPALLLHYCSEVGRVQGSCGAGVRGMWHAARWAPHHVTSHHTRYCTLCSLHFSFAC